MNKNNRIKESYLIQKKTKTGSPTDFDNLRTKGIALTQKYSGSFWTDYNLHDPGLTILEYLCYALTDLAYRTNFDIGDLLTNDSRKIDANKNHFIPGRMILTTYPVTPNDFKKIIIDQVYGIHNVWIEPIYTDTDKKIMYRKGLYKISIQLDHLKEHEEDIKLEKSNPEIEPGENEIIREVRNCVSECRNICEDFNDIVILKKREVKIEANIKIDNNKDPDILLSEIVTVVYHALCPRAKFYTEAELLQKGYSFEFINSGPALKRGYLLEEEFFPPLTEIDPREIERVISGIDGVLLIEEFSLLIEVAGKNKFIKVERPLKNEEINTFFYLDLEKTGSTINLFYNEFRIPVNKVLFSNKLHSKLDRFIYRKPKMKTAGRQEESSDVMLGQNGIFRDLKKYFSIQNLFPEIYNLKADLGDEEFSKYLGGESEVAKIKQLKAYLMLFEQVIANYLSQLANIDNLFSADLNPDNLHSYFTQAVYEISGTEQIIKAYNTQKENTDGQGWESFKKNEENDYIRCIQGHSESDDVFIERKNKILDHLLSRFNIVLDEYPILLFNQLYYPGRIESRVTSDLQWKSGILKHIDSLLGSRNQAFNYQQEIGSKGIRMGGFEIGLRRFLYIGCEKKDGKEGGDNLYFRRLAGIKGMRTVGDTSINKDRNVKRLTIKWKSNGENLTIFENPDLVEVQSTGYAWGESLVFNNVTMKFFKNGLIRENYSIENIDEQTHLLYELANESQIGISSNNDSGQNEEKKIMVVGKFENYFDAVKARNKFIGFLREVNIESEGFHLVEHNLLLPYVSNLIPITQNLNSEEIKAFFSFKLSVILPRWPARFQDDKFRDFVEKIFIENTPVHIRLHFVWLGYKQMEEFENLYFAWLTELCKDNSSQEFLSISNSLVQWLKKKWPPLSAVE